MFGTAHAADGPARVVSTFDALCLPHVGETDAVRAAAAAAGLRRIGAEDGRATLARGGVAFDGGDRDGGLVLLSLDDGLCGVIGGPVDVGAVMAAFAASMAAMKVTVTKLGDAPDGMPQAYRLAGDGIAAVVMLGLRGDAAGDAAGNGPAPGAAGGTVSILATPLGAAR